MSKETFGQEMDERGDHMATITEKEYSTAQDDRSNNENLITQEYEHMAEKEAKKTQILNSMAKSGGKSSR